jgi:uncharacterized membrane protein YhaH (DUF805 family)
VNCDAIPESLARVVGKLGTSLSNRAHRENFWWYWCFVKNVVLSSDKISTSTKAINIFVNIISINS